MYQGRVELTDNDIYNKQFKVDARGYNPKEVDRFLDIIIKDYGSYNAMIGELQDDKKELIEENMRLKQDIRSLQLKMDALKDLSGNDSSNVDVLRRLSNLEKIIYGKE